MVGTAALPHILMRYYTTPSVKEARESVTWSAVLHLPAVLHRAGPGGAGQVRGLQRAGGHAMGQAAILDRDVEPGRPGLLSVVDINKDGIFQLGEMKIGGDIIVLATAEIGGLPYVVSGMVAAGGLAAALSTADGLLLTIANALSHDLYYKMIDPNAPTSRRVAISKALLLVVALAAAYVAAQKPADILFLVSAAFSFAAAAFFPALTLGIFWKRANKWGASLGMICGLGTTFYYMVTTQPWLRGIFGVTSPMADNIWWGIQPISAGVFGVPVGFAVIIIVSLITPASRPGNAGPGRARPLPGPEAGQGLTSRRRRPCGPAAACSNANPKGRAPRGPSFCAGRVLRWGDEQHHPVGQPAGPTRRRTGAPCTVRANAAGPPPALSGRCRAGLFRAGRNPDRPGSRPGHAPAVCAPGRCVR
jgi:Na+(H+)/acetate symporter ActP